MALAMGAELWWQSTKAERASLVAEWDPTRALENPTSVKVDPRLAPQKEGARVAVLTASAVVPMDWWHAVLVSTSNQRGNGRRLSGGFLDGRIERAVWPKDEAFARTAKAQRKTKAKTKAKRRASSSIVFDGHWVPDRRLNREACPHIIVALSLKIETNHFVKLNRSNQMARKILGSDKLLESPDRGKAEPPRRSSKRCRCSLDQEIILRSVL